MLFRSDLFVDSASVSELLSGENSENGDSSVPLKSVVISLIMITCINRFPTTSLTPGVTHRWLSLVGIGLVPVVVCLLTTFALAATCGEVQSSLDTDNSVAFPCGNGVSDSTEPSDIDDRTGCTASSVPAPGGSPAEDQVTSRRAVELRSSFDAAGYLTSTGRRLIFAGLSNGRSLKSVITPSAGYPTLVSLGIRLQT